MAKGERLLTAFVAEMTQRLSDGFLPDPVHHGHQVVWRAGEQTFAETGRGAVQVYAGISSSPVRLEVAVNFGWCIPTVDKVVEDADPESMVSAVTVGESINSPVRPENRRHAARFIELTSEEDVTKFVDESVGTIRTYWSWWIEHFATVDSTIDYLRREDVTGKVRNYGSGYVLSLQHDRFDDAEFFVKRSFAVNGPARRNREEYDKVAGFLRSTAEVVGRGSVAVPEFEVLAEAEAQRRSAERH